MRAYVARVILTLGTSPTVQRTMTVGRLELGGVSRARHVHDFASGKSINVARVLTQLGVDCLALGLVGGARGEFVRRDLDDAGIKHHLIQVKPRTRFCVTVVDERAGTASELVEEPAEVEAVAGAKLIVALRELLGDAELLVLSGSVAPGLREDFYARCAAEAHERGVPVIVDGRGPALVAAAGEGPLVVKPNREELAATVGRPLMSRRLLREAMSELAGDKESEGRGGADCCIVTRGASGAAVLDGGRFAEVVAPAIRAVSPVGSGDAFAAGLAVRLAEGQEPSEASRFATACGAANALTPHAGHLDPADVYDLEAQVRVIPA